MIIVPVLVRMGCQVIQFTSVETFPQGGGVNPISSSNKTTLGQDRDKIWMGEGKGGKKGVVGRMEDKGMVRDR